MRVLEKPPRDSWWEQRKEGVQIFIRKFLALTLLVTVISFGGIARAEGDTKILIVPNNVNYTIEKTDGGTYVKSGGTFDLPPFIQDGILMVSVRGAFEKTGTQVTWENGQAVLTRGDRTVVVTPNSKTVLVNGVPFEMPTKAILSGGRTFVPLRFVAERLSLQVGWNFVQHCAVIKGF